MADSCNWKRIGMTLATLLERGSGTGVFLWILQNF